jgi:GTP-binding protein LepA
MPGRLDTPGRRGWPRTRGPARYPTWVLAVPGRVGDLPVALSLARCCCVRVPPLCARAAGLCACHRRGVPPLGAPSTLYLLMDQAHIRNFSIIAHIDHGKSTLADRILELTKTVQQRDMRAQLLDSMELERERGITIKAQAVRVFFKARDGETYQLHLIDTPGHVDFTYEVSRSLAACEGALLVVDASQGVEAQTVANTYLAVEAGLELIPCLNKLDLPGAEPERVAGEVSELIGEPPEGILRISGKTGEGVSEVLEELVARVPPPSGDPQAPPRALIFDSEFDQYRGVIAYIRVVDGVFRKGARILAMATGTLADIDDIGCFSPQMMPTDELAAGEVGYLITGIKDVTQLRVGDTLTVRGGVEASEPLPGYREVKPMVFCGLFPIDSDDYPDLRDALEKLALNDAALSWEPETSDALGFGFRCGFLGLLHMDIVRERLEREYDLELLATMPSVQFDVTLTSGEELQVHNPSDMPDPGTIAEIREPTIRASIIAPREYVGAVMELCQERRGEHAGMHYLSPERVQMTYDLPLAEIVLDFFDQLKSRTRGYASLDYELSGMKPSQLVKLDVLLAGDPVDALSMVVHRDKAYEMGRTLTEKLRKRIPRQQYDVPIQAAIGSHVIARETVKAFRKDVIAKCYGGDITRKRKLLEKQKEGKKRMKQVGRVEVPQEAFLAVLELGDEE